nr:PREDICTED: Fanconi anemia group A protein homolog isoform X1 [Apteryx mantelli mantelli]
MSWPLLFHSVEKVPRKYCILRSAASDHHIRLLPVAFYSLTPCFHQELFSREQTFLCVALDLYIQLLQLFVEGEDLLQSNQVGQGPGPAEHHISCSRLPLQHRGSLCSCLCQQAACSHLGAERSLQVLLFS